MLRICIYPKDVVILTGKSERYGREIISQIKKAEMKEKRQPVTVEEFCNYMRLDTQQVLRLLNERR
jgi:hypothetical protein